MFLFKLHNNNSTTKNGAGKKRVFCFVYIKTRLKKYIFNLNKRKYLKKYIFVLCFFFLQKQIFLFFKKRKKTSTCSIKKGTKQMVFYVTPLKLKPVFETLIFLLFARQTNTCFLMYLHNTFTIKKAKNQCFI